MRPCPQLPGRAAGQPHGPAVRRPADCERRARPVQPDARPLRRGHAHRLPLVRRARRRAGICLRPRPDVLLLPLLRAARERPHRRLHAHQCGSRGCHRGASALRARAPRHRRVGLPAAARLPPRRAPSGRGAKDQLCADRSLALSVGRPQPRLERAARRVGRDGRRRERRHSAARIVRRLLWVACPRAETKPGRTSQGRCGGSSVANHGHVANDGHAIDQAPTGGARIVARVVDTRGHRRAHQRDAVALPWLPVLLATVGRGVVVVAEEAGGARAHHVRSDGRERHDARVRGRRGDGRGQHRDQEGQGRAA
eukprot:2284707-Prymnesium_polylepis.1